MIPDVTCPECEVGKHRNCTVTVLLDDDTETPCICAVWNHELLLGEVEQRFADGGWDDEPRRATETIDVGRVL